MNSEAPGVNTSYSEVTAINRNGFWLLVDDREYFVSFEDYPGFQTATVPQIYGLQRIAPGQFSWPELDIDLELDALAQPEQFPLSFRR